MTMYTFEIDLSRGSTRPAYQVSGADTLFLLNTMPDELMPGDQIHFSFHTRPEKEAVPGPGYSLREPLRLFIRPVHGSSRNSPFVEPAQSDAARLSPSVGGSNDFYDYDYCLALETGDGATTPTLTVDAVAGSWRFAIYGVTRPSDVGWASTAIPFLVDLRCELLVRA